MRLFLLLAVAASAARASSVSDEVSVSSTQTTEQSPRAGTLGNALNASFDVTDDLTLSAGVLLTHEGSLAPVNAADFGSSGGTFTLVTGGLDWNVTDNFTVGVSGEGSPQSSSNTGVPISGVTDPTSRRLSTAYLNLQSQSSEWGAGLDVSYDTFGDSNLEWSFDGAVKYTSTDATQGVGAVNFLDRNGTISRYTAAQLRADCAAGTINCPRRVVVAARNAPAEIDSFRLSAGAIAIVAKDTDIALSADYYVYTKNEVAYASLVLRNLLGNGLPMAPLQYLVRPEVTHRWGDFSARLWVQAGQYVAGEGDNTAGIGVKAQYKFTKALRAWLTVTGQRDVDALGGVSKSSSLAAGAAYRW